jgi:hypothetical protein
MTTALDVRISEKTVRASILTVALGAAAELCAQLGLVHKTSQQSDKRAALAAQLNFLSVAKENLRPRKRAEI